MYFACVLHCVLRSQSRAWELPSENVLLFLFLNIGLAEGLQTSTVASFCFGVTVATCMYPLGAFSFFVSDQQDLGAPGLEQCQGVGGGGIGDRSRGWGVTCDEGRRPVEASSLPAFDRFVGGSH